jgi:DNA-binding transcriptional MerR regulator
MEQWTISQVARQVGLRASAIRYYEQIGVVAPARRAGGQRRYDTGDLHRLALVQRARAIGFSLTEIRELFTGFPERTPLSRRWRELAGRKIDELEAQRERIRAMQDILRGLQEGCRCSAVEECGRAMLLARRASSGDSAGSAGSARRVGPSRR